MYRRRRAGCALVTSILFAGGCMVATSDEESPNPPRPAKADALSGSRQPPLLKPVRIQGHLIRNPPHSKERKPAVRALPAAVPQRISIQAISVDAPIIGLKADKHGRLETPPDDKPNLTGWYQDGVSPGSTGTALIVGHLDTRSGTAAFFSLGSLHKGNTITVQRADHRKATFTIDAVEEYKKDEFPNERVYARANQPELRLITCGGKYSKGNGYDANTVVYAHLTKTS